MKGQLMKLAMIFSGYGSQYVGMGKEIHDRSRSMQEMFEVASQCVDLNLTRMCFASSDAELSAPVNAYLSIFLVQAAYINLLQSAGIKPDIVAGYGIGEYAALHAANGLNFADGLYALKKYALFCDQVIQSADGMVIVVKGLTTEDLQKEIDDYKSFETTIIAAYNSPLEHVVSGCSAEIFKLSQKLERHKGVEVITINSAFGFHSKLMDPVIDQFSLYLTKVDFKDLSVPLIGGYNGQMVADACNVRKALVSGAFMPLQWHSAMKTLGEYEILLLIGKATYMEDLLRAMYPDKKLIVCNGLADLAQVQEAFPDAQFDIDHSLVG
jgi:[acyl-carrier-protein] S-malonyltransferase